jgi:hypothetical protein
VKTESDQIAEVRGCIEKWRELGAFFASQNPGSENNRVGKFMQELANELARALGDEEKPVVFVTTVTAESTTAETERTASGEV